MEVKVFIISKEYEKTNYYIGINFCYSNSKS
jgi:hypothetical protein